MDICCLQAEQRTRKRRHKNHPQITQITQRNGVPPSGETVRNCNSLLSQSFSFHSLYYGPQSPAIGEAEVSSAGEQLTKE